MTADRVLIVGNPGEVHVGRHLRKAAEELGLSAGLVDVTEAGGGSRFLRKLLWAWDRRPTRLDGFSRRVVGECDRFRPDLLISTGVCPLDAAAVSRSRSLGVRVVNFATDDPFNPAHRAGWFLRALPMYDAIITPRRANMTDLTRIGCREVRYLPFAYAPDQHRFEPSEVESDVDLVFVGGADSDRVPLVTALISSGFRVALYGGYWDRHAGTRASHRGSGEAPTIRRATVLAKVCLILVRRANRDGHVMRSFEAAACGGSLLVEDTAEHRDIFANTVTYFSTPGQMVSQARSLLADACLRRRLAEAAHRRITVEGRNTYADRLRTILEWGRT